MYSLIINNSYIRNFIISYILICLISLSVLLCYINEFPNIINAYLISMFILTFFSIVCFLYSKNFVYVILLSGLVEGVAAIINIMFIVYFFNIGAVFCMDIDDMVRTTNRLCFSADLQSIKDILNEIKDTSPDVYNAYNKRYLFLKRTGYNNFEYFYKGTGFNGVGAVDVQAQETITATRLGYFAEITHKELKEYKNMKAPKLNSHRIIVSDNVFLQKDYSDKSLYAVDFNERILPAMETYFKTYLKPAVVGGMEYVVFREREENPKRDFKLNRYRSMFSELKGVHVVNAGLVGTFLCFLWLDGHSK